MTHFHFRPDSCNRYSGPPLSGDNHNCWRLCRLSSNRTATSSGQSGYWCLYRRDFLLSHPPRHKTGHSKRMGYPETASHRPDNGQYCESLSHPVRRPNATFCSASSLGRYRSLRARCRGSIPCWLALWGYVEDSPALAQYHADQ